MGRFYLVHTADYFPITILRAGQPPLVVGILRIRLPGIRAILNGRVEVHQELSRLSKFSSFNERVQPGQVFFTIHFVPGIADGVQLAAGPRCKFALNGKHGVVELIIGVEREAAEVD